MSKTSAAMVEMGTEDFERELQRLWSERTGLEKQLAELEQQVLNLTTQAPALKKKMAAGDKSASTALDRIDTEAKGFARKADGVRLLLRELDERIEPMQRQLNEHRKRLADTSATEARERRYAEQCDSLAADVQEFLRIHAESCRLLGQIKTKSYAFTKQFEPGVPSTDPERLAIARADVERLVITPLANPVGKLTRDGWKRATGIYSKDFEIEALVPPPGYHQK